MSRIVVPPRHARLIADATMLSVHDKLPIPIVRATTATTLTSWARAIRKALDAAGVDSAALFAEAGLDVAALADAQARYPVARTNRLWQLAVEATGDPAFALIVARQSGLLTFHALGYSLSASATLREAFERLLRYFRVVSDGAELRFRSVGAQCIYEIAPTADGHAPIPEAVDAFAFVVVRLCRGLYARDHAPLEVRLRRPQPADPGPWQRAFKAPVAFGADRNELIFDAAAFDVPLETANPELARQNDEVAARYLARFGKSLIRERLRAVLIEQLPRGEPSQDRAAEALHLSSRSLQRRLAIEATSYKTVLDDARRELALSYLREARHSISEITYLLGYSDTSSFTHAFQRWTGIAPSRWKPG
ncbi:AraC family transcriptional regulator [uncultured Nevskia sp.]|uniref:AraC family transcriptional regulator n=1 Tax=uncultured Nevskia sp. TaxID=228950 RepID=UPI0025EF01CB|nr:AraC family transcriptional regulator [uncultured Nevskia sp.]